MTDVPPVTQDFQVVSSSQPLVYIPTVPTTGTLEDGTGILADGTIHLQLTEDGRLVLPPGLKLYTTDGQEVGSTSAVEGQAQQEQPGDAVGETSSHVPSSTHHQDASNQHDSASESHNKEEG